MRGPVLCEVTVNFDNYFLVNVHTAYGKLMKSRALNKIDEIKSIK